MVGSEPPVLLRRDQPDRPRRIDRSNEGVSRVEVGEEHQGAAGRRVLRVRVRRGLRVLRGSDLQGSGSTGFEPPACGVDDGEGDYLNCPFTREEYQRVYDALVAAERAPLHEFDEPRFFEGCLPIEVMASRGVDTLRFGPMKPVGLVGSAHRARSRSRSCSCGRTTSPAITSAWWVPDADEMGRAGARAEADSRASRTAEFVRFGMIHRNTYINGPTVLRETWQTRSRDGSVFRRPDFRRRGIRRIGRVRSAGRAATPPRCRSGSSLARRRARPPSARWRITSSHANPKHYQPTNITFGIMPPLEPWRAQAPRKKADRNAALSARALAALASWIAARLGRAGCDGRQPGFPNEAARPRLSRHLHLNENASVHTVRAYESDLVAVHRLPRAASRPPARPSSRAPTSSTCTSAPSSATCTSAATRARPRRGSSPRSAASGATCGAKGVIEGDPGGARGHAETRAAPARPPGGGGDVAPARDAGRLGAARPPRPRHPGAVLRLGASPERACRPRTSRTST